jgi:hypothetical protein
MTRRLPSAAALAFLLVLALFPIRGRLDRLGKRKVDPLLYLPDKRVTKVLACGHGTTAADLAMLQATSYVIDEFNRGHRHIDHLYDLFDAITELDENFVEAYESGAVLLASIAQRPEAAERLLEKGVGKVTDDGSVVRQDPLAPGRVHPAHPRRYKLALMRGTLHLVSFAGTAGTGEEREAELRKAGRLLLHASRAHPDKLGDPKLVSLFETLASRRLTDRQRAQWELVLWEEREKLGNELEKAVARRRIDEARSELGRVHLEEAVRSYRAKEGRLPAGLKDLATEDGRYAGLEAVPEDPLGVGYRLEGDRVRARGVEAARLERVLERRIAALRAEHGRPPRNLTEHRSATEIPSDMDAEYDAETGSVRVRPK